MKKGRNRSAHNSLLLRRVGRLSRANCSAQVWVETVIYTLIGLAVIGILLAVAKPKIDEIKDKAVIDQSIEGMDLINAKIQAVRAAPGNRRVVDVNIDKGRVIIDNEADTISWVIDNSEVEYSQVGVDEWVPVSGHLEVNTVEASPYTITLKMEYSVDLRYEEQTTGTKELDEAPTPYLIKIENRGLEGGENTVIVLSEE
ncbi:hypothetical protein CMI37_27825 [Candidatus Pacearchaeota archaeon]|nr:hypothetical protein [Candidatus Pacearchaeota archaeon]